MSAIVTAPVDQTYHHKKRIVEGGKERDLLSTPLRTPSTAHAIQPLKLRPSSTAPSYWSGAAQAARRTREVADELFWASMESADGCGGETHQQLVLGKVSKVSTLPLTGGAVAPSLRNSASNMVQLALRGRSQWEHQRRKFFGASMSPPPSTNAAAGYGGLSSFGGGSGGGGRPSTAGTATRPGTAGASTVATSMMMMYSRPGTAKSQQQQPRPGTAGSALSSSSAFSPNSQQQQQRRCASAASVVSSCQARCDKLRHNRTASSAAVAPHPDRWQEFDKSFHSPLVSAREVFEFERRFATSQRYKQKLMMRSGAKKNAADDCPCTSQQSTRAQLSTCNDAPCLESLSQHGTSLS